MTRTTARKSKKTKPSHLFVIQHGFMGSAVHTKTLVKTLSTTLCNDRVIVLNCSENERRRSMEGIEATGTRLFEKIMALLQEDKSIRAISLVGYSFGGIMARYAAGRLYDAGVFESVTPVNFVTFATPHLGSRRSPKGMFSRLFNHAASSWCTTTQELVLDDLNGLSVTDGEAIPMLYALAEPESIYMQALELFENLTVYANTSGDRSVGFASAALLPRNPYRQKAKEVERHDTHASYPHVMNVWAPVSPRAWDGYQNDGTDAHVDVASSDEEYSMESESEDSYSTRSDDSASHDGESYTEDYNAILKARRLPAKLLGNVSPAPSPVPADGAQGSDGESDVYAKDQKRDLLTAMLRNLNQLPWRRVDVRLPGPNAHAQIVVRRPWFHGSGKDVLRHFAQTVLVDV